MGNYHIEDIKSALETGKLTPDLIGEKLQRLVDMEYQKPVEERDEQLILTCEKLLYELYTGQPYVSRKEENKQELLKRLDEEPMRSPKRSAMKKVLAGACALIACAVLAEGFLHRQWFSFGSSPDSQQYVVQGHEIDPQIIAKSIADHSGLTELETEDLDKLIAFIGFDPGLPAALSEEWHGFRYYTLIQPSSIQVMGYYSESKEASNIVTYNIYYYTDAEKAYWNFEQNSNGTVKKMAGQDIYFVDNVNKNSAFWILGHSTHQMSGKITKDELAILVNSVLGENYE